MQLVSVREAMSQGIEVFRLDLDLSAELSDSLPHLTPEERGRAARFVRAADRLRFAQTRAATRRLLGRRLGCCPADVPWPSARTASLSWMTSRTGRLCSTSRIRAAMR